MGISKHTGSTTADFIAFLNANKVGTFLENAAITNDGGIKIVRDGCTFCIKEYTSSQNSNLSYTNGTLSSGNMYIGTSGSGIVNGALLCKNGIIMSVTGNSSYNAIGLVMLTADNNDKLCCIWRDWSGGTLNSSSLTNTLKVIANDSTAMTAINISPAFNLQKTALIPIVTATLTGDTTIPNFYTAMQTELSSIGLQAVTMEGSNYITNGYCFIKD